MKKIYEKTETTVNYETGETTERKTTSVKPLPKEPDYIKLYMHDLFYLTQIPKSQQDVLYQLLQYVDYENNIILSARLRKKIADDLQIKPQTLSNKIHQLARNGLIEVFGRNDYAVNPNLFGRGDWKDILQRRIDGDFELKIEYKKNQQKVITTTLKKK